MFHRPTFFKEIRASVFRGKFSQKQVDGLNVLLDVWERDYSDKPYQWLAAALGTAYHETAHTMQPIREYGKGRGRKYGRPDPKTGKVYYGRGYVQLTWKFNYEKASRELGFDFVNNPDLVMVPEHAARILFQGSNEGWFTGKGWKDYIDDRIEADQEDLREYANSRRVINGTDRQVLIGGYNLAFDRALKAARIAYKAGKKDEPVEVTGKNPLKSTTNIAAAVTGAAAVASNVDTVKDTIGGVSGLIGIDPKWILLAVALAAGAWIISERIKKSRNDGV